MKKATNKLYIVLGMLAMMLFMAITPTKALAAETVTVDDWEYTISDGSATISKYKGTDAVVTIPSKVTIDGVNYTIRTIGGSAFENNATMTKVIIPKTITTLGNKAFKNCNVLAEIVIEGNLADCNSNSTDTGSFRHYSGYSVFMNAGENSDGLTVTFAEGVTRVPAFIFATGRVDGSQTPAYVTRVVFADTVTEIGDCAFYNCTELTDIQYGEGVTTIGNDAFRCCTGLQTLTIGSKVQTIGNRAFRDCTKLTDIKFSNSVTKIGESAFENCTALKSATLPTKTNTIGNYAFMGCTALETLVLPEEECSLGANAFKNCTALKSITVKGNIADCSSNSTDTGSFRHYSGYSAFMNAGQNAAELVVTFTDGVTRVPAYLFATGYIDGATQTPAYVKEVILSDTVTEIGKYAFYNCTELEKITIPDNVALIDKNALFNADKNLTLYVYDGSYAYLYAKENELKCKCLDWNGWRVRKGSKYWYEKGDLQGWDENDPAYRGKEIYDPSTKAWYWLDNVLGGAVATSKDVYQESLADDAGTIGKWVRYDENGLMIKGWDETENGKYYFDLTYGTMLKGMQVIDGKTYIFNSDTGILEREGSYPDGWNTVDGVQYWYENGVRQGYDPTNPAYRGKEIFDPGTGAWYWLDNVQLGARAVSKDVYQESQADAAGNIGKWVRYDENGLMIKGWDTNANGTYYFDLIYGTMLKGYQTIDGKTYYFDENTGVLVQ